MCLRAQVPRQPPPGKMVRRGGDGRSRLGAMATDPEVRPEGSVAHASTGGASPPEDRTHQRPRGARPGRVVSAGVRPGARTAKGTRARLSDSVPRRNAFPAAASHGQRAVSQQRPKRLRARSERIGRLGPHEVARHPRNVAGSFHTRERSRDRTTERRSRRLTTPIPAAEVGLRYRLVVAGHAGAPLLPCAKGERRRE
jgi:hypothetical protein